MKSANLALTAMSVAVAFGTLASAANAAVIAFDEFAADNHNGGMLANRYSGWGVTFVATDDGTTWGGISNGDPGNWDLEGTNGAIFSGFNGESSGMTMLFNTTISGFSLDASRSNGSNDGLSLLVEGYLGANLVDSVNLVFGDINSWSTFTINGVVDRVVWTGSAGFNPYGVDNVNWVPAVPIPAAAWLFGSALGVMGWMRRTGH